MTNQDIFIHESAFVDEPCTIGRGTRIWHFSHVMAHASIGADCIIGQNVHIASNVTMGDRCKIQNNVSLYQGVCLEDHVFLGPSCVFTNIPNPRAEINRRSLYARTLVKKGATVGANATIVPGVEIGRYAFIAAGAVLTADAPDYALMVGVPARQTGWMSRHGHILKNPDPNGIMTCPESGWRYQQQADGIFTCLDYNENDPLPENQTKGEKPYDQFKA